MDITDELNLKDVLLIDQYFSNELSEEERKAFKKRLRKDKQLQEDYLMIQKTYYQEEMPWLEQGINLEEIRLRARRMKGKELLKYGLWLLLFMGVLLLFSSLTLLLFSS